MNLRQALVDCSRGDGLRLYWKLFYRRERTGFAAERKLLTWLCSRMACRHGGYIGAGAVIEGIPTLPHGLHGVYISRLARIGAGCRIYQNVTIGEAGGAAPRIGEGCLIGAGAVLVGGITIGSHVKIGAGAVVGTDVPDGCTVVAQPPRILKKEGGAEEDGTGNHGRMPDRPGLD